MDQTNAVTAHPGAARLQAFVDAAFAFAVTLLVLSSGDAIPRDAAGFFTTLKRIPAFAVSFALIAMFWYAHVQWSARAQRAADGWYTFLSFALVFAVLVFVYPLRAMAGRFVAYFTGGALPADIAIAGLAEFRVLAMTFGLAYLSMSALMAALYARTVHLNAASDELRHAEARVYRNVWMIQAAIALLSFVFAASGSALLAILSLWWYAPLALILPAYGYWERRRWLGRQSASTT